MTSATRRAAPDTPGLAADARAAAETRRLALELLPDSVAVSQVVLARVLEVLPELAAAEGADDVARESTDQNIGAMLATLAFAVPPSGMEPPIGTRKLLRQAVAGGGDATTLLHAYRVGHERLWEVWSDHVAMHIADRELQHAVLRRSSAHFFTFIDRSCEELVEEYRREFADLAASGNATSAASRREVLDVLLGDTAVDLEAARGVLGYELRGHHLGLVLRPVAVGADVRAALDAILAAAGRPSSFCCPAGDGSVWAWLGWASAPPSEGREAIARVKLDGVVVGLGEPGHDRDGFRATHEQAAEAEQTVRMSRVPAPGVVAHESIALAALLCSDRTRAERLCRAQLGVLTAPDEASARLRHTLAVFLACGRSKVRTAEQLFVHQKTVTYRIARAEQLLGRPVTERSAELDAALRIHRTLFGD
ncbi:helix-turn-helix domain-containing protein [Paraconexibacter antarcticus]|uniref:Helix-turn-helix domain-containing protein n=1 Tax=Paraconexibacter antarcticus TaxID=2949664 RepID=A0ABY5DNG3_9ACTN|nr:helix-turn-helix domain-containing protein [Paraconexibacter antarcticus]UTI62342.1 helix-turn-helix domain-containing protein [Paraconexibacter antarcticus]